MLLCQYELIMSNTTYSCIHVLVWALWQPTPPTLILVIEFLRDRLNAGILPAMNWLLLNDYWFLQFQEKSTLIACSTWRYTALLVAMLYGLGEARLGQARSFKSMKASHLDDAVPMNFPFIGFSMWNLVIIPPLLNESS